jgi:hypothetical protein
MVIKDSLNQYMIKSLSNNHCIGLTWDDGMTLNGKEIHDEAVEEIAKLEEDMFIINVLPSEIMMG